MLPERWKRVTAIFEAALDLPPDQQLPFVRAESGDDIELLAAVERLLNADSGAAAFLAQPVVEAAGLVSSSAPPATIGRYEILERIGHGGFGDVFKARDPVLKRPVAVKTCRYLSGALRERFAREAEIAAGLDHPNITIVHDVGLAHDPVAGTVPFLVQEFLPGEDLDHVLAAEAGGDRPPLSLEARLRILLQVAAGLAYAHQQGVVHRDIKPGNVRLLGGDRVKIMDFGIAKLAGAGTALTQSGALMGTVAYMSPEQIRGEDVDARSDLFSFGVLAYELLTSRCPFAADSQAALMYQVLETAPPPLGVVWPGCPPKLAALVERCLVKRAAARFSGAEAVVAHLEAVLSELGPEVLEARAQAPTQVLVRPPRRRRGRRAWWWTAAALVAAGVLGWSLLRRPAPLPSPAGPAGPPARGQLVVDALPWGEIITLAGGEGLETQLPAQRFTPVALSLAPGRYRVELRHPRATGSRSCEVEVVSGGRVSCLVEFARVDVAAFLDQVGD